MIYGYKYEPYIKRLPTKKDYTTGIQTFDLDNLYPQKAKEIVGRSFTLKGIIDKLSGFTAGQGFRDRMLADLVVHFDIKTGKKITANKLLRQVSSVFSWADAFAIHVCYNLNYKISSIKMIPYEFCRFGLADSDGDIMNIKYSTNWEKDWSKGHQEIITYPIFNPDPNIVKEQIKEHGGILNYKGQILFWTPEESQYPKATFDPVFDQAQVQSEIGTFQLADIQNGFSAGHFLFYPGTFADTTEEENFKSKMALGKGAGGANSVIVIETGTVNIDDPSKLLVKTDLQNNDKIREFTSKDVKNALMECYGLPKPILGIFPESGMFNQQEIRDSYDYTNTVTSPRRKALEEAFKEILMNFEIEPIGDFEIEPQQYIVNGMSTTTTPLPTSSQAKPQAQEVDPKQSAIDQVIRGLSRRDISKIYSYVNDFKNGRATIEQTKAFLKPFLQTDDNVNLFIQDPEGDG